MIRTGSLIAALIAPLACHGQDVDAPLADMPRAWQAFDPVRGYADLSPDRFGTVADPEPNEMGMLLVLRMFRNVCLGLEHGEALDRVMPEGFSAHASGPYLFGLVETGQSDARILSATGSVARDEDDGHPAIWLRAGEGGRTCAIEWTVAEEIDPGRRPHMANVLGEWLPFEMSLVRASRPTLSPEPAPSDVLEWDRPCFDRWCPVTASYNLSSGHVRLETRLNITDIGGDRP